MMMPQQDFLSCLPAMSRLLGVAAYLQLQLRPMFQQLPQSTLGNNNFRSLPIHQVLLHCTDWNPFSSKENPLMAMLEWEKKRRPAGWGARVEDSGESIWRRRASIEGHIQASVFTDQQMGSNIIHGLRRIYSARRERCTLKAGRSPGAGHHQGEE